MPCEICGTRCSGTMCKRCRRDQRREEEVTASWDDLIAEAEDDEQ